MKRKALKEQMNPQMVRTGKYPGINPVSSSTKCVVKQHNYNYFSMIYHNKMFVL